MSASRTLRTLLAATATLVVAASLSGCFGVAGPAATPKPSVSGFDSIGDDPEPIDPDEPVEPTAEPQAGFTTLTDDYEVLTIQVPAEWTDVTGQPFTSDAGEEWASIAASTDLDEYFATFNVSGVEFAATPIGGSVEDSALSDFLVGVGGYFDQACEPEDTQQPYSDGFYTGYYSSWVDCAGVGTSGFAIVAVNPDATHVVYVRGQITADDDRTEIVGVITATFQSSI